MKTWYFLALVCVTVQSLPVEVSDDAGWQLVKDADFESFCGSHDCRGQFGPFTLVVDSKVSCSRRADCIFVGTFLVSDVAWVATADKGEQSDVHELVSSMDRSEIPRLFHSWNDITSTRTLIITTDDGSAAVLNLGLDLISVPGVPFVPMGTSKVSLASQFHTTGLEKNPIVVDLMSRVSEDELKSTVEYLSETFFTRMSSTSGAKDAEAWLASEYKSIGLGVSLFPFREGFSSVVVGELRGSVEPNRVVLVGAHYDSRAKNISDPNVRAPGADDNGSGTASLLAMARAIKASNVTLSHTIRFLSFSGEEQGLVGSRAYAKHLREQGEDVVAMLNGDMLAYRLPGKPATLGLNDVYVAPWLLATVEDLTALYFPDLPQVYTTACCSDHQSFYENGLPSVGFFEHGIGAPNYPEYHTSKDLPELLDFAQHELFTQVIVASLATLAGVQPAAAS